MLSQCSTLQSDRVEQIMARFEPGGRRISRTRHIEDGRRILSRLLVALPGGLPLCISLVGCPSNPGLVYRHTHAFVVFGHGDEHIMVICQVFRRCFEQLHVRQDTKCQSCKA